MPWSRVLKGFAPDEANVNDYSKSEGSRLLMHWDDRGLYEEILCSVTVLGECVMTFRPSGSSNFRKDEGQGEEGTDEAVRMHIPARSLLVLRGAARYEWQHGVPEPVACLNSHGAWSPDVARRISSRIGGLPSSCDVQSVLHGAN